MFLSGIKKTIFLLTMELPRNYPLFECLLLLDHNTFNLKKWIKSWFRYTKYDYDPVLSYQSIR